MQGGMQSISDAISAGVPLIGIPMLGDQWFNVETTVLMKIGVRLDVDTLTEENMMAAVNAVIEDKSYRRNIISLRETARDQPQSGLERAVWWSEYVIRHKGAPLLRAPTALISYWDYFELDLLALGLCAVILFTLVIALFYILFNYTRKLFIKVKVE